jgi:predicted dehydrogenase
MRLEARAGLAALALLLCGAPAVPEEKKATDVRLMTLDPGHFHASLVQKEMYPGVAKKVDVYAPLGQDLFEHLNRIARFNARKDSPTAWELEIHTGPDFLERMLEQRPGNVVVISGRNRGKIERVQKSLERGLHVLVDKPWILEASELPALERALATADAKGVVGFDIMTERFEVTSELQKELVNDKESFGTLVPGSEQDPAVYMESVHHLKKVVAGAPNMRPAWFFDTAEQGEGVNDIGTHLVDLVQWTLFPEQALDAKKDFQVLAAQRWPTLIPLSEFRTVTAAAFPDSVKPRVKNDVLEYFCNSLMTYRLRGNVVKLSVIWDWEAPHGDTHFAWYRGSRSKVEVRQGSLEKYRPELYVVPASAADKAAVLAAVTKRIAALQPRFPKVAVSDLGSELRIDIPDALRVGHEDHFAQVAQRFLQYVRDRRTLPAWERPNMIAKYAVTTQAIALARTRPVEPAPRLAPK